MAATLYYASLFHSQNERVGQTEGWKKGGTRHEEEEPRVVRHQTKRRGDKLGAWLASPQHLNRRTSAADTSPISARTAHRATFDRTTAYGVPITPRGLRIAPGTGLVPSIFISGRTRDLLYAHLHAAIKRGRTKQQQHRITADCGTLARQTNTLHARHIGAT